VGGAKNKGVAAVENLPTTLGLLPASARAAGQPSPCTTLETASALVISEAAVACLVERQKMA